MLNESRMRWIAVVLFALNLVPGLTWLLSEEPRPAEPTEIEPLDATIPRVALVGEERPDDQPVGESAEACYTIGPLPTLLAQQRARERLAPFTDQVRLRRTIADHDRGWWVYLPAGDRAEALEKTRLLAERGVEDYYIVAGGEFENAVSVGLYENVGNARSRQETIRSLGFSPEMEIRREEVPQFWVDYRVATDERPPWRFIVRASPGAQRVEIPCFSGEDDENVIDTELIWNSD
ncbi:MAG: hypothetical protein ACOCSR_04855 [Wenzhouxiangella sp.]